MKLKSSIKFILIGIILLAAAFRFYNINWDSGYHLHPDERAIILATTNLRIPHTLSDFLSPESLWNPHFFAYGSLPFYLLHFAGGIFGFINIEFSQYSLLQIPGRVISALSDLATILLLFILTRKLLDTKTGLFAAFLYAVSVLPIQLSHFYAVDTLLTLFILVTLYQLVAFYEKPSLKRGIFVGFFFGLALATKISAIVLVTAVGVALIVDFVLLFIKQPHKPKHYLPHIPAFIKHLATYAFVITITTFATFMIFEPYAIIDFENFWQQTLQQSAMTKDAFTFPYTLQYVGKIPYLYELKNIFFFGLGPVIATLSFVGFFLFIKKIKKKELILLAFFIAYCFVVGKFAIGFMRYMLPVYPLLCLFAAIIAVTIYNYTSSAVKNKVVLRTIYVIFLVLILLWPISFIQIYTRTNPRVAATDWIINTIPVGKTLAVEHWDDQLPLSRAPDYPFETLALYEPDTVYKWDIIGKQLEKTDYIILSSNRLYAPLQKLTDCAKLPHGRCYQQTTSYYQRLFNETLGFKKIAEFTNYPTIPFFNIPLNDQWADESFTVYDHPKVIIFKKTYDK